MSETLITPDRSGIATPNSYRSRNYHERSDLPHENQNFSTKSSRGARQLYANEKLGMASHSSRESNCLVVDGGVINTSGDRLNSLSRPMRRTIYINDTSPKNLPEKSNKVDA